MIPLHDEEPAREPFPLDLFTRLARLGVGRPGQRVLDIGTGTGPLAREFARRGCRVTGLDTAAAPLAIAEAANRREVIRVRYVQARAEATGLPDASVDLVSAGNIWHQLDRAAAAAEAARLLAPGGHLLIAHLDWLPRPGGVVARTQRLLDRHGVPDGAPTSFVYPDWTADLIAAGFNGWDLLGWTDTQPCAPRAWRHQVRTTRMLADRLSADALARLDAALARMVARTYPGEVLAVEYQLFALVAAR